MTHGALIALCASRIDGLSRARLAFEHSPAPERLAGLIERLRGAAAGWDAVVSRPPDGDTVALRLGARSVRDGVPGFDTVADVLDTYASALEEGQALHADGLAGLRSAQRSAAALPADGVGPDGTDAAAEAAAQAALAVLDAACAGYAACQDAYVSVGDAERALYAALAHVRVSRPAPGGVTV